MDDLRRLIRDVPDFPASGILFRDITPLLRDASGLSRAVEGIADLFRDDRVDLVAGIESRGFILGAPLATALGVGFVPIRKLGKLPSETVGRSYALEYGENHLEMHRDAVRPGERVLLVDDLLATGGTARAAADLVEEVGGIVVGPGFLVELTDLGGRGKLSGHAPRALLRY
jgi:adenine phosphoribosyltransferase